jgi:hypothetical protein
MILTVFAPIPETHAGFAYSFTVDFPKTEVLA